MSYMKILCFCYFSIALAQPLKIALCLITKDENIDLYEWIDYHKSIGVNNVIIVENNSSKSSFQNIADFVKSGYVFHYSYFARQLGKNNQLFAYNFCLENFKSHFSHMGFLDTDEFIVLKNKSSTVIDLIEKYKDYGGLTLNWMVIGSNGHLTRPPGGILKNYNQCFFGFQVKSIVNVKYTVEAKNPHRFKYIENYYAVDTGYNRIDSLINPSNYSNWKNSSNPTPSLFEIAYIYHYLFKSKEDWDRKIIRGFGVGKISRRPELWSSFVPLFNKTCDILVKKK